MITRPNVLLFISDQQRADTVPGESPEILYTPHLEWMSERCVSFRRAFCASPLCTPSRCSILTGRYPHETGVECNYHTDPRDLDFPPGLRTMGHHFGAAGYDTAYAGKWHLPTGDSRPGFNEVITRGTTTDIDSEESDDAIRFSRRLGIEIGTSYKDYLTPEAGPAQSTGDTKLPLAHHPTTRDAMRAANFIRSRETYETPFLLVFSCIEPHPMQLRYHVTPAPFSDMYSRRLQELPLSPTRHEAGIREFMLKRDSLYGGLKYTDGISDEKLRDMTAGYFGAVSYVDHILGQLLEALVSTDQFDNTIVVFTSDHGEMLGDHGMLKKGPMMYDELLRIPFLFKPPGHGGKGRESHELLSHIDLLPTLLPYCQIDPPSNLAGVDFGWIVKAGAGHRREGIMAEYYAHKAGHKRIPLRCWRTREWKYVESTEGDDELYDLCADPGESVNLAGDPDHRDMRTELRQQLLRECAATGDPWPEIT